MTKNDSHQPLPQFRVNALGISTSYSELGDRDRETLVLLHGMSAASDTFRELMIELADKYRLIAPDMPGFGYSDNTRPYTFPHLVEWLAAFLAEVDAPSAHILGHSFGGALGVSFALSYPDASDSLILLAPSVLRPGKFPQWLRVLARTEATEKLLSLGVSLSRVTLERQMRSAFHDPAQFDDSLWERRKVEYQQARASAAVMRASALHDIRPRLPEIQQPSCIIWGQNDPVLDPGDAVTLSDMMPESRTTLHLLPRCGHLPHIERRDTVIKIVDSFLHNP